MEPALVWAGQEANMVHISVRGLGDQAQRLKLSDLENLLDAKALFDDDTFP